jgi:hypothetical protein
MWKLEFHKHPVFIYRVFEFILKVGVEDLIVNAQLVRMQRENTNNAKSKVRFKQLICDLQPAVRSQSILQRLLWVLYCTVMYFYFYEQETDSFTCKTIIMSLILHLVH